MRRFTALILRSFLQGLLILCPIGITGYIIYLVFDSVDTLLPFKLARGVGFLIIVSCVTLIGYLGTRVFIGRILIDAFDHLLEHTPGIKYLYSSLKDIMDSFVGDKKRFNNPVWVRVNQNPELWRIGFLTQEDLTHLGLPGEAVAVYLPHSYAISGWVVMIDRQHIRPVMGMNAVEAMKFAVSGGVAGTEDAQAEEQAKG
jgi:uncharacterized membrane protein